MQMPIQITFHDLPPSPALEAAALEEIPALESVFDRIVSCRVAIEKPHQHHHKGNIYRVRIDLGVPGKHIVIGRSPEDHLEHTDAHLALRDAFRVARRRLQEHAQHVRGEVKSHTPHPERAGAVPEVHRNGRTDRAW